MTEASFAPFRSRARREASSQPHRARELLSPKIALSAPREKRAYVAHVVARVGGDVAVCPGPFVCLWCLVFIIL